MSIADYSQEEFEFMKALNTMTLTSGISPTNQPKAYLLGG